MVFFIILGPSLEEIFMMKKTPVLPTLFSLICLFSVTTHALDIWADPDLALPQEGVSSSTQISSSMEQPSSSAELSVSSSSLISSSSEQLVSSSMVISSSSEQTISSSLAISSSSEQAISSSLVASSSSDLSLSSSETISSSSLDSLVVSPQPISSSTKLSSSSQFDPHKVVLDPTTPQADAEREARRKKILGNVKVSKIQTAKDLGSDYKSPKTALFYSLILPGAGQAYVGDSKWTYARGAAYLIAEASLWYGYYHYTVEKYNSKRRIAQAFVERNYDLERYEEDTFTLRSQSVGSDPTLDSNFNNRYLNSRESFCQAVYGADYANSNSNCSSISSNPNYPSDWDRIEDFESLALLLEDDDYVLGWDDAQVQSQNLKLDTATYVALGTSEDLSIYRNIRSQAKDYADMAPLFITGVLVNHVVSAIDAAWAAHSYNQSHVQKNLSWYHKVRFNSAWGPTVDQGVQWQGFLQAQYSF